MIQRLLCLLAICYAAQALRAQTYTNPVVRDANVPDPGVILYNGAYYAVTTADVGNADKYPIRMSTDLVNWKQVGYVFPQAYRPQWVGNDYWAPEIHIVNNKFHVYYTGREASSGILCIGVATSDSILGPYIDKGSPLVKNLTVGSIDSHVFKEGDVSYLIWKADGNGNRPPIPTPIWAQPLTADGLGLTGEKVQLITNDRDWEHGLVEGPWVIKRQDYYYLFFSGGCYDDATYAVGVARSKSLLGPYTKQPNPILHSSNQFTGPGHCSVVSANNNPGKFIMVYHSWLPASSKHLGHGPNRLLLVDEIKWTDDNWPYITGDMPSYTPQPIPVSSKRPHKRFETDESLLVETI